MRLLALLGLLLTSLPVFAQGDTARVRGLVPLLGSEDFRQRERAGAELLSIGEEALTELKDAAKQVQEVEVSERLRVIIQKLDRKRISEPRRITYRCVKKPYAEVFADLAKLSGYPIELAPDIPATHVSFDWKNVPILQAIDEVCDSLMLFAHISGHPAKIFVANHDSHSSHRYYHGPLRITLTQISSNNNRQLSNLPRKTPHNGWHKSTSMNFSIDAEPKISIAGAGALHITELIDDTGKDWLREMGRRPGDPLEEQTLDLLEGASSNSSTFAYFDGVNRKADSLKSMKGKSVIRVITGSKTRIEIPQITKNLGKSFDGSEITMTVQKINMGTGNVSVEVCFRRKRGLPEDNSWITNLVQHIVVTTTTGVQLEMAGLDSHDITPNSYTAIINYAFKGQEPTLDKVRLLQLEWETMPFVVEMKDIPLP
ncbi:MAG: hypothetical protein ACRC8S_07565 [Fimbriiglobus sp.]